MRRFCWSCVIIFFHRSVPKTERFRALPLTPGIPLHGCRQEALTMKKNISIHLALLAMVVLIVLPVNSSVKQFSSNPQAGVSVAILSGSPLQTHTPPGSSVIGRSGSPLPTPTPPPPGSLVDVSGSPLPTPTPPGFSLFATSGSPLPTPTPPPPGLGVLTVEV